MRYFALILVAICVAVFVLQNLFPAVTDDFALVSSLAAAQPWRAVTYIFLHGSIEHLLYNMFALALFGSILEKIIGGKKFLMLFFMSGLVAAAGSILFYDASVGASGAIFGLLGCLAVLRPRMTVWLAGIPMPMFFAAFVWAAIDLFGIFFPANIANIAHLSGLIFGIFSGFLLRKQYGEPLRRERKQEIDEELFRDWENKYMVKLFSCPFFCAC